MNEKNLTAQVVAEVKKAIVGKDTVVVKALAAILARGHILLEDIPGVGKTTMALAFAKALNLQFSRVQFTPDVMPSDITGFSIYHRETGKMEYQPGAVMCNLFLADELNRATSRTQSALLEAMEEGQVTVDGVSRPVPQPFLVIATQNPVGASGTQKLPDSQMDRFLLRLSMGYPAPAEELELLRRRQFGQTMGGVEQVIDRNGLELLRQAVDQVYIDEEILKYIVRLVDATRKHPQLLQGASPRATLAVTSVSRAVAFLKGRDYTVPEDVQNIWVDAIAHRLLLVPGAERTTSAQEIAQTVLRSVDPPGCRNAMLRRRILYALALLFALMGQLLDTGYLFHFIFYAALGLPVLGLLLSLPSMLCCRASLEADSIQVPRGGEASWALRLTNRFRLPIARASYRLRVTNRMTGQEHTGKSAMRSLAMDETRRWTLETDHCGAVECQVERLWVCDCLGLFALPVRRPPVLTILVTPLAEEPGPIQLPEGVSTAVPQPRSKTMFGETYELRPYRPGDSMRMIHWKMSAKRDELVTREPPEDTRPLPVLTFDLFGPLDRVDRMLDRLEGHSMALLEQGYAHQVRWVHPKTGTPRTYAVAGERDWLACLAAILSDPAPLQGRSIQEQSLKPGPGAPIYPIHVTGKEEANGEN